MLDSEPTGAAEGAQPDVESAPVKTTRRRRTTKATAPPADDTATASADQPAPAKRTRKATKATKTAKAAAPDGPKPEPAESPAPALRAPVAPPAVTFLAPPEPAPAPAKATEPAGDPAPTPPAKQTPAKQTRKRTAKAAAPAEETPAPAETTDDEASTGEDGDGTNRRRRRGRRGRGRGRSDGETDTTNEPDGESEEPEQPAAADESAAEESGEATTRRRRRRRRSSSEDGEASSESGGDEVKAVKGSTRLEAKRQRRRDGREQTRRRPPILSESEFLARRESVERSMVVRQRGDRTQIAVLEDKVLVEHYVTKASSTSYAGNVYLGRVQNVLPSMEAAFVDIGKGRNAVLYAGEVNWDLAGLDGKARNIEQALKSGDSVLVQVSKDPIAHKGARLTSQISLPGRYLVYVPGGAMTGISRKLPDVERTRLKAILRKIVPDDAGVIIRTAAEGASEEELTRDVNRLKAQWEVIEARAAKEKSSAPTLLYEEPDLAIRVVRDIFNEDFAELVIAGDEAWETLQQYVEHVAPDLKERLHHHTGESDVFHDLQVDEQLAKALDRKVWLPSGGSLVIDRTEAMTVIDVNTGKFTGQGGNLEETVTRNNLEAAEEIVRQLRLRDIGGIIVIDFIDMVLESNRDLVLRRLTECLGRDRTRHQVAEVTSLGLVQMTRKRVGQGLLEAFSEPCPHCNGRGLIVHSEPVEIAKSQRNENGKGTKSKGKSPEKKKDKAEKAPAEAAPESSEPAEPEPVAEAQPVADAQPVAAKAVNGRPRNDVAAAGQNRSATATATVESNGAEPTAAEPTAPEPAVPAGTNGSARPRRGRRRAAVREAGPPAS